MKYRMRLFVSCICLINFGCTKLFAQDLASSFELAEHLFEQEQYTHALEVYQRIVFFDSLNLYKEASYFQMASCFQAVQNWEEAIRHFNLAYFSKPTDAVQKEIQFQLIATQLLSGDFISAKEELLVLEDMVETEEKRRLWFYKGISFFGLGQIDSSQFYFSKHIGSEEPEKLIQLKSLFKKARKLARVNPSRIRTLSMIIPGAGQFYAGDLKNGFNSLILTSSLLLLGIHIGITVSIVDALLSVGPWYLRYYQGGFQKAEAYHKDRLSRKNAEIYQRILGLTVPGK